MKAVFLTLLCGSLVLGVHDHGDDCGTIEPSTLGGLLSRWRDSNEETKLFGDSVSNLSPNRLSSLFRSFLDGTHGNNNFVRADQAPNGMYQLKDIPIVFHVLPNQDDGGSGSPSLTQRQAEFATNTTNKLFTIYDRESKESIEFASFRTSAIINHDIIITGDCGGLSPNMIRDIVASTDDWMFQVHIILCETNQFSGRASLAGTFSPTDPQHNVVLVDYRALACYDSARNFLCEANANGEEVSHTRWWRSRSAVLAHEIGHLFGLYHTFQGGCLLSLITGGDQVSDTPNHDTKSSSGCPGLLPYDKDRDILSSSGNGRIPNSFNESTCSKTCGSDSCAACCTTASGAECPKYTENPFDSLSEDSVDFPQCCSDPRPIDTCGFLQGLDPLNNVMSYIPDECSQEFTVGQMARMIAQIRLHKPYIYCSYSSIQDTQKCSSIPCGEMPTSPNCIR